MYVNTWCNLLNGICNIHKSCKFCITTYSVIIHLKIPYKQMIRWDKKEEFTQEWETKLMAIIFKIHCFGVCNIIWDVIFTLMVASIFYESYICCIIGSNSSWYSEVYVKSFYKYTYFLLVHKETVHSVQD